MRIKAGRFALETTSHGLKLRVTRPAAWSFITVATILLFGFGPVVLVIVPDVFEAGVGIGLGVAVVLAWVIGMFMWGVVAAQRDLNRTMRGFVSTLMRELQIVRPQAGGDYRERPSGDCLRLDGRRFEGDVVREVRLRQGVQVDVYLVLEREVVRVAATGDVEAAKKVASELRRALDLPEPESGKRPKRLEDPGQKGLLLKAAIRMGLLGPACMAFCMTTGMPQRGGPWAVLAAVAAFAVGDTILANWHQHANRQAVPKWLKEEFGVELAQPD